MEYRDVQITRTKTKRGEREGRSYLSESLFLKLFTMSYADEQEALLDVSVETEKPDQTRSRFMVGTPKCSLKTL